MVSEFIKYEKLSTELSLSSPGGTAHLRKRAPQYQYCRRFATHCIICHPTPATKAGRHWSCQSTYITTHRMDAVCNVASSESASRLSWAGPCIRAANAIYGLTHNEVTLVPGKSPFRVSILFDTDQWNLTRPPTCPKCTCLFLNIYSAARLCITHYSEFRCFFCHCLQIYT